MYKSYCRPGNSKDNIFHTNTSSRDEKRTVSVCSKTLALLISESSNIYEKK